ncbi:MAG: hypothetical protein O3A19_06905 [Planctomycetota bacterium]|jgi:hypothetical protein|nr:hypothetical protein [Planctomycetota bacterium]MDA1026142.1 hypothetical protein [Planctomycetota bacterium]
MQRIDIPKGWRLVDDRDSEEIRVLEADAAETLPFRPFEIDASKIDVASVLRAADEASRRMEVLARELDCLRLFEEGDDGPRAA